MACLGFFWDKGLLQPPGGEGLDHHDQYVVTSNSNLQWKSDTFSSRTEWDGLHNLRDTQPPDTRPDNRRPQSNHNDKITECLQRSALRQSIAH